MLSGKVTDETRGKMEADLKRYSKEYDNIRIIGSGGNINKLYKLSNDRDKSPAISVSELRRLYETMRPLTIRERITMFQLKDDRADVIIPASEIFLDIAGHLKADRIIVPTISLADSIVDGLYKSMV